MPFDANGRWIPQPKVAGQQGVQGAPVAPASPTPATAPTEAAPVAQQVSGLNQLSGLLSGTGIGARLSDALSAANARRAARGLPPIGPQTGGGGTGTGGGAAPNPGGQGSTPTPTPAPTPTSTPAPAALVPGAPAIGTQPVGEDASTADQLTGLLASDSPYIQQAREAGERLAHSRGLLNSSIAAGNSEASAIAAAAPIASQDAAQIFQRNQNILDSWNQLRNTTTLQAQSDNAAMARQAADEKSQMDRLNAQLANAIKLQGMGDTSAMQRLVAQGDIETAIAKMNASNSLTQTQINANTSLMSNYMNALTNLAANPDIPADARNEYMAELLRVSQSGQGLVNALSGSEVTWPTATLPPATAPVSATPTPASSTVPASSSGITAADRVAARLNPTGLLAARLNPTGLLAARLNPTGLPAA